MGNEPQFENLLALQPKEIFVPTKPGPDEPTSIFTSVGFALSAWERLEEELCGLFGAYLGAYHPAAKRAYGSIVSGAARIGMMKEVIESSYSISQPEMATLHIKAMNQIAALAARRNEIAHGVVKHALVNNEGYGFCLYPSEYNTGKTHSIGEYFPRARKTTKRNNFLHHFLSLGKYVYTDVEIYKYASMFNVAKKDVFDVRMQIFLMDVKNSERSSGTINRTSVERDL